MDFDNNFKHVKALAHLKFASADLLRLLGVWLGASAPCSHVSIDRRSERAVNVFHLVFDGAERARQVRDLLELRKGVEPLLGVDRYHGGWRVRVRVNVEEPREAVRVLLTAFGLQDCVGLAAVVDYGPASTGGFLAVLISLKLLELAKRAIVIDSFGFVDVTGQFILSCHYADVLQERIVVSEPLSSGLVLSPAGDGRDLVISAVMLMHRVSAPRVKKTAQQLEEISQVLQVLRLRVKAR